MKLVAIDAARSNLASVIAESQEEPVCLTRHGRPVALLVGVEERDIETVLEHARQLKGSRSTDQTVRNRFGLRPVKKVG